MPDRIDHIAIVVDQLSEAQAFVGAIMNMALVRELTIPERSVRVAFYQCGSVQVELIEVTDPASRERRLGDAKARIEHLAIQVDDIHESVARLEGLGVEMASRPQLIGGRLAVSTNPSSSIGVIFQLLQETPQTGSHEDDQPA